MIKYERVKFLDGDAHHIVFLRITSESPRFLHGVEVDKEGEEIEPPGFSQRVRVLDKGVVVWRKPYSMDLHYGELVPSKRGR